MEQQKTLSASSIKALESCSWLYWAQYEQKIPQRVNEGAQRGTIAHLIFELLLLPKHKKHFDLIINSGSIEGSPAVKRLVLKHLRKEKILKIDNYKLMDNMILVGLRSNFFGEKHLGATVSNPEFRFELENQSPLYKVRGYIDKFITYPNGKIKIVDYKSSKSKFSGDELEANIQSFVYSLVGYKLLKAKEVVAEFIFLRYSKQPLQQVRPTKEQLSGFEHYLAYLYSLILQFNKNLAQNNLAINNSKNRWLCKTGSWVCPYLNSFKYYALFNENGTIARTAMMKENLKKETGQILKEMWYEGCPGWKNNKIPTKL